MSLNPGEIYWADVPPYRRPVIIVSREELNRGAYAVIVPLTSEKFPIRRELPNCIPFYAGQYGLTKDCVAQAEAITLIELAEIDTSAGPIGRLDPSTHRQLIRAIGYVLSATLEPA
jgi:mRNA-degrading endonuclease toxin of MazEF toxin-antitoxin module